MNGGPHHHLKAFVAVMLLVATSVASAAMLAPDRTDLAFAQITLLGMSIDDICGGFPTHVQRCPYCHLLPDTPIPSPAELETRLLCVMAWHLTTDLYRAAQERDHDRSPRAPPHIVLSRLKTQPFDQIRGPNAARKRS